MIDLKAVWFAWQYLSNRVRRDERGEGALSWVVIAAIAVVMALAAGLIIYQLTVDKANEINTDFTPPPAAP